MQCDDQYLEELLHERTLIDSNRTAHCFRLLENEITAVKQGTTTTTTGGGGKQQNGMYKPFEEDTIELNEKIFLPIKEFPTTNFVGKILGSKGTTLKGIQAMTHTRILILGHGSLRDSKKEEELISSGLPDHDHLKEPIHLRIKTRGHKSEAYGNIANALAALTKLFDDGAPSPITDSGPSLQYGIPPPGAIILGQPGSRQPPRRTTSIEMTSPPAKKQTINRFSSSSSGGGVNDPYRNNDSNNTSGYAWYGGKSTQQ